MTQMLTRDALMEQLRKVREPCGIAMGNPLDICEMGLIDDLSFEGGHVRVTLCLTDPGCVHFRSLQRYIADVLREMDHVETVEVTQTTTKLWTPDRVKTRPERA